MAGLTSCLSFAVYVAKVLHHVDKWLNVGDHIFPAALSLTAGNVSAILVLM